MRKINHRKGLNVFILMGSFLLTASQAQSFNFQSSLERMGSKTLIYFQAIGERTNQSQHENAMEQNPTERTRKVNSSFGWEITNCL
ncbi:MULTISPECIES: hypothetical protein [Sphingobacterium]|uniref:hypothetical protein n=1 Tax=Sphingobacterium TaxID=28453 RepID=UPI0016297E32|nr:MULTISPECIES: hypothetical protein [Sphingobacterium]